MNRPQSLLRVLFAVLFLALGCVAHAALPYTSTTRQAAAVGMPVPPAGAPTNPVGMQPSGAVIGDFDNDGRKDMVVVTIYGSCTDPYCSPTYNFPTILFYPGDGLGGVGIASKGSNAMDAGPPVSSALEITAIQAADLNHDGNLDIVFQAYTVANGGNSLMVAYGDGHGGFSEPGTALPIPGSYNGVGTITLKDINHDGWVDIVVSDNFDTATSSGTDILVYLNNGSGHFTAYGQYGTPTSIYDSAAVADFGGDGNADVVGVDIDSSGNNGLVFVKGNSDGTFQDWVTKIPHGTVPSYLTGGSGGYSGAANAGTAADIDGDGCNDYVLGDMTGGVWWFRGHCNDTFDNAVKLANPPAGISVGNSRAHLGKVFVADFNADGRKDIAYAGVIYLRQANGTYVADLPALCPSTGSWSCAFLASRDLNGDGRPDLVATNRDPNLVTIFTSSNGVATNLLIAGGNNQSTVFSTAFPVALKVRVVDGGGFPVANTQIWYAPPTGLTASASIPGGHGWTDAQGYFSAPATANFAVGCYSVDVQVGASGVAGGSFELCNTAANSLLISSGTPQSQQINQQFANPLIAQVLDGANQPAPGILVFFTAPSGGASSLLTTTAGNFAGATNAVTAITDASGKATVYAQANGRTGSYTVSVSAPFYATTTGGFALTNTPAAGAAAQIVLTPAAMTGRTNAQYAMPLVAQIADSGGTPILTTSDPITFAQTNDPSLAAGVLMSTANTPCTTGTAGPLQVASTQGQATIYLCANGFPGQFHVAAADSADTNVSEASATLSNRPPAPASIALSGGTPQATPINTPFVQTLQVQLLTSGGQPAPFAVVFFSAPSSGPSAVLSATRAVTDQNGVATVTATANGEVGSYAVDARVFGDMADPIVNFALTNTAQVALTPVPTLSQWGALLLSLLLATMGVWRARGD